MGDPLLIGAAKMGMDVRLCGPKSLWPDQTIMDEAQAEARASGARITVTDDLDEGVRGCDFLYTDVWVSMGEPEEVWAERIKLLMPYQVNAAAMQKTGNPRVHLMHCLPAFHNTDTEVGAQMKTAHGIDAMEVTEEVFESPASIASSTRPRTGCTRSRRSWSPRWGAEACGSSSRRGGNALLRRDEPLAAKRQRRNVRIAADSLAQVMEAGHQRVITHGNGPQVGLLALQGAQAGQGAIPLDVLGARPSARGATVAGRWRPTATDSGASSRRHRPWASCRSR